MFVWNDKKMTNLLKNQKRRSFTRNNRFKKNYIKNLQLQLKLTTQLTQKCTDPNQMRKAIRNA